MESRCKAGVIMASTRSGGGVPLRGNGVQLLGYRGVLVVALLFVTVTTFVIEDVHCSITIDAVAPAPTPSTQQTQAIATFNQYEADALNAVFQMWSKQNPQLSTLFNWSLEQHPCNNLTAAFEYPDGSEFEGAWSGVGCTSVLQNLTEIPKHYQIFVKSLHLYGSNSSCGSDNTYNQCGFDGIVGQLPSEISNLTNLQIIEITNNPKLTGPVPVEIFQSLPYLESLDLHSNSLSGTLPSDVYNADCKLGWIDLGNNNFSGSLRVSAGGALFCSSLYFLNLDSNQLDGPIDFQDLNVIEDPTPVKLYLSNNHFKGTFSTGPYFDATYLDLSNNDLSSIQLANYIGPTQYTNSGPIWMPSLYNLNISSNNFNGLFPKEIFGMSSLLYLDLSMNNFFGPIDFGGLNTSIQLDSLYINNNNFNGTVFTSAYFNPTLMDLSNNQFNIITFHEYIENTFPNGSLYVPKLQKVYFQNNSLKGQFPTHILTAPSLKILYTTTQPSEAINTTSIRYKILMILQFTVFINNSLGLYILDAQDLHSFFRDASQNQYETMQLPNVEFENSSFSQIFITNNILSSVKYSMTGPFTAYNLQYSSFLFLGGNPICDKIENPVLSSICRLSRLDQAPPVIQKSNAKMKVIIATSTSSTFVFVLLVTTIYVWRLMGRIKALRIILKEFEKKEVKPNLYSYREIKLATNNFDKDNKLGQGGFGVVYKGKLFDGTQVAVKKLTMSSNQGLSEFLNEVIIISGLKHRNLVKLKGCCLGDGDQRILVFEYVENKNLAEALWIDGDLQNNIELPCLDWETRFNIILGIARGLAYLHEDLQPPIIHRDIKATNILLDKIYNPKIADFGLAYLFPTLDSEASHLTLMQVAGTRGYCSPEYALHGHVSTALDVYSFGILMLEIVSGRKNTNLQKPSEEIYLREWTWKQYEAKATMTLVDAKMEHSPSDLDAIMRVIVVALACVHYKAAKRPKMNNVLSMLFENMPISEFQRDFEDGEAITEVGAEFPLTLCATSSLWSNENLHVDDCCLLNNIGDIEMNSIVR